MRALAPTLCAALVACAGRPVSPRSGMTSVIRNSAVAGSPDEAFGAQVRITDASNARRYGEVLACDERHLYVRLNLPERDLPYDAIAWGDVAEVLVWLPGAAGGAGYATWTILGTISTISHGWFAVYTAGVWIGVGTPASVAAGNPSLQVGDCRAVRAYARFPQGLPEAFRARHYPAPSAPSSIAPPSTAPPSAAPWSGDTPLAPTLDAPPAPPPPASPPDDAGAPAP